MDVHQKYVRKNSSHRHVHLFHNDCAKLFVKICQFYFLCRIHGRFQTCLLKIPVNRGILSDTKSEQSLPHKSPLLQKNVLAY